MEEATKLLFHWKIWARDKQVPPPGDWVTWLVKAGRGWGKTRTGAEFIRDRVESGVGRRIALVAKTPADVRDVMLEGESGLITISPKESRPVYTPARRRVRWPNGAVAHIFTSYDPDQLRGPQFDTAWCDELAAWKYPQETWVNLTLALRLGDKPQVIVTTTPKPINTLREIINEPTTALTSGSTYENQANLSPVFFRQVISRYKGTRTERQEIFAELLEEAEGALWKREWIDLGRVKVAPGDMLRICVAIDPAVSVTEKSDETGIIVGGLGADRKGYILEDCSGRYTPDEWATKAIDALRRWGADRIVAEKNNGGDMVKHTIRQVDRHVPVREVFASRGKRTRAEPISAQYAQGGIVHVGSFAQLEDQYCNWEPLSGDKSPDRLDAAVWCMTDLMLPGAYHIGPLTEKKEVEV